jgi:hypothetical protein
MSDPFQNWKSAGRARLLAWRKRKGDMGSSACDLAQRSAVDVVTKYNDGVPKGVAVQQTVTLTPNQVRNLIGHHVTDPLRWPARSAAETVAGQIFSVDARIAAVISQGIRRNRIRRVTGKLLRYYVVAQYISPTPESWSRRASK